jgi:Nuclear fragile X mental retardation-interacting protein 1 (NUFIP1)/Zinc finger C-x8-C-x5-C-x3-H type (and similar)
VGNHPDDIAEWIAERKKKFPKMQTKDENRQASMSKAKADPKECANQGVQVGLASLLDGYGSSSSSDEEDGEEKEEIPVNSTENHCDTEEKTVDERPMDCDKATQSATVEKKPCYAFMNKGRCRNGDQCPYSHDVPVRSMHGSNRDCNNSRKSTQRGPATLLQKLLVNDQRRETTVALELLQYIYESSFLEKDLPLEKNER